MQILDPKSRYVFKVLPKCTEGVSVESEAGDPIETGAAICQPGKPCAIDLTHNSQWFGKVPNMTVTKLTSMLFPMAYRMLKNQWH